MKYLKVVGIDEFKKIVEISSFKSEIANKLGFKHCNGIMGKEIEQLANENSITISHLRKSGSKCRKYEEIEKECPVCFKNFKTQNGHPREKITCSHSCSNTYFRSGPNNGSWKDENDITCKSRAYRSTCFHHHEKKCIVCGEENIIEVHHFDRNKENNRSENLIPLCPTHHQYVHSRFEYLVKDIIEEYRNNFIDGEAVTVGGVAADCKSVLSE